MSNIINPGDLNAVVAEIRKSYTSGPLKKSDTVAIANGLVNYDLQAPAKALYPVNTPIRNRLPRVKGRGDTATRWKAITSIVGSGYDAQPYVPEGMRSGVMSMNSTDKYAPYTTLGEEGDVTFEAWSGATGFEDVKARQALILLQKMMLKEENTLLGGNFSVALGTPGTPVVAVASTGGTIGAGTYKVTVVALTYEGYRNWIATGALIATGIPTNKTITSPAGESFVVKGGSSNKSATTTAGAAITGTGTVSASVTALNGAVAYAWFVDDGAAGAATLQSVTTLNSVKYTALTTSGQNLTAITADNSVNAGGTSGGNPIVTGLDGLLYAAFASAGGLGASSFLSGAYVNALATGTAGTGTVLTSSGKGTCTEIDAMLKSMWDNYQVSPTIIWVNSQQIQDITTKCLNASSSPLLRINTDSADGYQRLMAGGVISFYYNPFTQTGGIKVPIMIHPTLPPGVILAYAENLPIQYQSNEVPNVAEVHLRRDYYQIDWPQRTRKFESGVYSEETLACYFPPAIGLITNIASG